MIHYSIRFRLTWLSQGYEYVEAPRERYELLNEAVKEMSTPYYSGEDFINSQIEEALEKYEEWKEQKQEHACISENREND